MALDLPIAMLAAALRKAYDLLGKKVRAIVASVSDGGVIKPGDALVILRTRSQLQQVKGSGLEQVLNDLLKKKQAALTAVVNDVIEAASDAGLGDELTRTGKNVLDAMSAITDDQVSSLVSGVTDELTRYTMQTVIAGGPADKLLDQIATKLQVRVDQAETVAEAMVAGFERTMTVSQAKEAGVTLFAYLGPDDGITRPWCSHWVDRCGTPEEFEETSGDWKRDKQPLPVMVYGGGYNCRHRFVPLVTKDQQTKYPRGPR